MGLERRHGDPQPVGERQLSEESVELSGALGPVQADGGHAVVGPRPSPQTDEMPLARQLGRSRRLGLLTVADFGLRRSPWNLEVELDEELDHVGSSVPARSATM